MFWLHFFILNFNYLTVFYMIFVFVAIIYLVWYIFICFIFCFIKIYLFFELFLLIIVTSYCIPYSIYPYILVHMKWNYLSILSHILHWIVIIFKQLKKISLYHKKMFCFDNMESVCCCRFIPCFFSVTSTSIWYSFSNIPMI